MLWTNLPQTMALLFTSWLRGATENPLSYNFLSSKIEMIVPTSHPLLWGINKIYSILVTGEGYGTRLQYSCLGNPMDGGPWKAAGHGVAKSRTRLSDFTFTFHFHALEKEMTTHSSVLAWRIPGMGEPVGLPSMGSQSQTQLKQLSSSSILVTE